MNAGKPLAIALGKTAFYRQIEMDLSAAYAYTSQVMADNLMAHDAEEGIGTFIEVQTGERDASA